MPAGVLGPSSQNAGVWSSALCNAGLLSGEQWYKLRMASKAADPQLLMLVPPQALAEALTAAFGLKGPSVSIDTACAAGANAIGYGADLIRFGHADAVLAGGADALSDILIAGFNSLESLSPAPAAPYLARSLGSLRRRQRHAGPHAGRYGA